MDASTLLIKEGFYAPSVHCSYYGCLQFLKYTLKTFLGTSYEDIESQSAKTVGSHKYIINNILLNYRNKVGIREYKDIKRSLLDLTEFRIQSDYENKQIIIDQSEKALTLSKSIIEEIKKKLK